MKGFSDSYEDGAQWAINEANKSVADDRDAKLKEAQVWALLALAAAIEEAIERLVLQRHFGVS